MRRFRLSICFLFVFLAAQSAAFAPVDTSRIRAEIERVYGPPAGQRFQDWRDALPPLDHLSEQEKLVAVNDFFNKLIFIDDIELWGMEDYWATPLEFLGVKGGDCEDFSIAKYFTLVELGIPKKKLRLFYVKALEYNQFHMVVGYFPKPRDMPLILDNIDPKLKPASLRKDLKPYFSFNGQHVWSMKVMGRGKLIDKADGLTLWQDLRDRYLAEQLNKPIMNLES